MDVDLVAALQEPLPFYTVATIVMIVVVSALLAVIRLPGVWVPIRTRLIMLPVVLGAPRIGRTTRELTTVPPTERG